MQGTILSDRAKFHLILAASDSTRVECYASAKMGVRSLPLFLRVLCSWVKKRSQFDPSIKMT
ncbi:hypothetical protein [Coleofasciculus sp. FACHB-1120]|uniref:hypothetical protein n=1 Tax=Coleofasciculus sp. FACHB-1120 TaxID=2692783 RepID=UPI0016866F5F|nr:hypothetical protein [Coleofasciculus sp. FACHB-1120]MBD2742272.1 hypothetical protein [Coleofasciculus sp. FACHB-1120]